MSHFWWWFGALLFIAVTSTETSAEPCVESMCEIACSQIGLSGHCDGDGCKCINKDENCNDATTKAACYLSCKEFKLEGECDGNGCVCKLGLPEPCDPWDCEEQCKEDPRCPFLINPLWCLEYGPIKFCGCLCARKNWWHKYNFRKFGIVTSVNRKSENEI